MLREYAIDPEFLVTAAKEKKRIRELNENEWGPGTHRLNLRLPDEGKWHENIYYLGKEKELSFIECERLQEYSTQVSRSVHFQRNLEHIDWNGRVSWAENIDNVNRKNSLFPFQFSFTELKAQKVKCFSIDDLNFENKSQETKFDTLWYPNSSSCNLDRNAENLIRFIRLFICASKDIFWVDPYFSLSDGSGWKETLIRILKEIKENGQLFRTKRSITIYTKPGCERSYYEKILSTEIEPKILTGTTLKIIIAEEGTERKFHNRYIISELGCYSFPHGTDCKNPESDKWSISLMNRADHETYYKYYSKYSEDGLIDREHLILKDEFLVIGE
jgi:hypothetical protein